MSRRRTESRETTDRRGFLRGAAASGVSGVVGIAGFGGVAGLGGVAGCLANDPQPGEATDAEPTDDADYAVETVSEGVSNPWGLAFLPNGEGLLVTQRDADLLLVDRNDGSTEPVAGSPAVHSSGQGGLLDVALDPAFPADPWVYLTFSRANDDGESATHFGRGRLDRDGPTLEAFETLHVAEPFVYSRVHYGSRVVFGDDGMAYVTVGDRGFKDFGEDHVSQDRGNELGATLRLAPDGTIPEDNPFVDDGNGVGGGDNGVGGGDGDGDGDGDGNDVAAAIYSYGHRNVQAMAVHPETGAIWQGEHGESDGDEINVVEAGGNHGWPIATYACAYGTDSPIGDDPAERDDLVAPVYYWECGSGGFPPAGMTFYTGGAFPAWDGDLFVGTLAGEYLGRFVVDGREVTEADPLLADRGWRIRDVATAPDTGHLYVAVDDDDAPIVRIVPS